jgi:hypothetical protein
MDNLEVQNKTLILVAKRNSGKSYIILYLIQQNMHLFDKVFVITPTEKIKKFYGHVVPENQIFDEYKEDWVDNLITKMSSTNANKPKEERRHVLLVLDDMVMDHNLQTSPTLKKLFVRGRHCNIACIVSSQHLTAIAPIIRVNSDYVICGNLNHNSISLMSDEFLAGNIIRRQFIELYNKSTKSHNFLVINCNSIEDNDALDSIYSTIKLPQWYVDEQEQK